MRSAVAFFVSAPLWAQALQILPSPPSPDRVRVFSVMISSPEARTLSSLQWEIRLPNDVTLEKQDATVNNETRKDLVCAEPKTEAGSDRVYKCVLVGGRQPIREGAIATFRIKGAKTVDSVTIKLRNILGSTADGTPVALSDTTATVALKD